MARVDWMSGNLLRARIELPGWFRVAVLVALVVYWSVLAVATHVPSHWEKPPGPVGHLDKIEHFGAYLVLAFLLLWGMLAASARVRPWTAFAVAVGYGLLDEMLQGFVPTRVPDIWDLVADSAGALIGIQLGLIAIGYWKRRPAVDRTSGL